MAVDQHPAQAGQPQKVRGMTPHRKGEVRDLNPKSQREALNSKDVGANSTTGGGDGAGNSTTIQRQEGE